MIDRIRYFLAVLSIVTLPPGLLFWFVIHLGVRWWRRVGPLPTYIIMFLMMGVFGVVLFRVRGSLLGADLGTNWMLIAIALVLYGLMTWLQLQYRKHLSIGTLVGLPELSLTEQRETKPLRDGIYQVVRHPRYLSAGVGVIASALISNYLGPYLLILLLFPMGYLMVLLEERELADRFGEEYRKYQQEVPMFIPGLKKAV